MQLQVKLQKDSRNNVLRSKQTSNSVLRNIFRGFKVRKKGTVNVLNPKG